VHAQIVYPLVIALATVAVIAATTRLLTHSDPVWARSLTHRPTGRRASRHSVA